MRESSPAVSKLSSPPSPSSPSPSSTPPPIANRRKLWVAALKPPMYSVAIMPIWWGSAIAFYDTQQFNWRTFLTFMGAAILILAWENLTNDVFDADTGIDENKPHSIVNLTGKRSLIFALANVFLALGIFGAGAIAFWQKDITVLVLVLGGCGLGYCYQGPPFRWGYQGLGEILCFFSFGPLVVSAAYYSQAQTFSIGSLIASTVLGISTSLILFCSHFHQVEDDLAAGKKSPVARLGVKRSAQMLPWLCGLIYSVIGLLLVLKLAPLWTLLSLAGVPAALKLCRHVGDYYDQPEKVMNCKFIAIALHFWSGLFFGLGYVL